MTIKNNTITILVITIIANSGYVALEQLLGIYVV
jgi:hypothetical protein